VIDRFRANQMSELLSNFPTCHVQDARELNPPAWAQQLVGQHFTLLTERVRNVPDLAPADFERETFEAYVSIARRLGESSHPIPVRFWNHVPFITDPADAGRDNYMVFNAGRFGAFSNWFGGPSHFERDVATASGIGHWGRDLVIHCLSTSNAGLAVNNPRQVAPYHYSQRFGPVPPCFARATTLSNPAGLLLVGGTASVRGEDSVHIDDLAGQLRETFVNLASLIGAAAGRKLVSAARISRLLTAFRELRIYHPDQNDAAEIEASVRAAFPALRRIEMMHADLCRAELLVEIEGIADLTALSATTGATVDMSDR
jgi:chorismate lyase/3-hydroxybenzoate synthase